MLSDSIPPKLFLDEIIYSHPSFGGMESEPMLSPREKSPVPEKFSPEDGTHDAASSRTASPTHYQRRIPAPFCVVDSDPLAGVHTTYPVSAQRVHHFYFTLCPRCLHYPHLLCPVDVH